MKNELQVLYETVLDRKENGEVGSYTAYLYEKGIEKILKKVGEETTEVIIASMKENNKEEIVNELVDADITTRIREVSMHTHEPVKKVKKYDEVDLAQISLFDTVKDDDVLEELKAIDIAHLTPMDALNTLYRLQNKLRNRW